MNSFLFRRGGGVLIAAIFFIGGKVISSASDIFSVQSRISSPLSSPRWQLLAKLDGATGKPAIQPTLFGPAGGVYALAFLRETLYAVELENGTGAEYLATIPHEGPLIGQGSRVGNSPIGAPNVEGLAAIDDYLVASSIRFDLHTTTLIRIDPATGIGTPIGDSGVDEIIVGLAFNPVARVLYGAGIPFGTQVNDPNLYVIDPQTGATTLVGNFGTTIQGLAWDPELGLIGSFDRFYKIDETTGLATAVGSHDYTDGVGTGPSLFNGLYGLAAIAPNVVTIAPFRIANVQVDANGAVTITWDSADQGVYQLEFNAAASSSDWMPVGDPVRALGPAASQTHSPAANASEGYYRVVRNS